jgi:hypothetical protein
MTLRHTSVLALFTLALGACDPGSSGDHEDAAFERGPIGKADAAEGSCAPADDGASACGGPAPVGNCWCDDACAEFGDCCLDAFDACGVGTPEPAVSQCLADHHCEPGQTCAGGVCIGEPDPEPAVSQCLADHHCEPGQTCAGGVCIGEPDPEPAVSQCLADHHCEPGQTCAGGVCIGEPDPDCDDGSSLHPLCDMKPVCDAGQVAAIQNACFRCVDAKTCD